MTVPLSGNSKTDEDSEGATYYVLDAGYKIPAIARQLIEDKKIPVMPYKRQ